MNSNIKNNNLYKDAMILCKFMKRIADLQQKHKLTRIRISVNNDEFLIPNIDLEEKKKLYNYRIKQKIDAIAMSFTRGYKHFRDENFGKPDNSIHIRFFMKKSENETIVIDKDNLLNNEVKIFVYIRNNEINYDDNIVGFVNRFVNKNFQLLLDEKNRKEHKKIVDSERYTKEELIKAYNLEGILN